MVRIGAVLFLFAATGAIAAQPPTQSQTRHYRLTFVLSDSDARHSAQTFTLDVPVSGEHRGMAQTSAASMLTEQPQSAVQETLQCTDVQESSTGLTAKISYAMESSAPPLPGSQELIHSRRVFNRQVDVKLNTPTVITEPMQLMSLKDGQATPAAKDKQPAPLQITMTASEI